MKTTTNIYMKIISNPNWFDARNSLKALIQRSVTTNKILRYSSIRYRTGIIVDNCCCCCWCCVSIVWGHMISHLTLMWFWINNLWRLESLSKSSRCVSRLGDERRHGHDWLFYSPLKCVRQDFSCRTCRDIWSAINKHVSQWWNPVK